jgi:hypothetical protein
MRMPQLASCLVAPIASADSVNDLGEARRFCFQCDSPDIV